jgi:hypothetical protein
MKRRLGTILVLAVLIPALFIMQVSANAPAPASHFSALLTQYPDNACYMDLLVPLSPADACYVDSTENFLEELTVDSPIYAYDQDGYMSYTFHYRDADTNIKLESGRANYFENTDENMALFETVKLAVLDAKGNVLQVSEAFEPEPFLLMAVSLGSVDYDYKNNTVELNTRSTAPWAVLYLILTVIGIAATVILEWLIVFCFPQLLHTKVVIATNLVTQTVMRILFVLLYSFVWQNYILWTVLLEILVYTAEYLIYRKKMFTAPEKAILAYTITANTVTLLIGLGINYYFMF